MKKIIVAIDSFKGCLTSVEANQAACEGILAKIPDAQVVQVPVSDGGEGSADCQTLMGKLPYGILQRAQRHDVPVLLIAGRIADEQQLLAAGFVRVACINPPGTPLEIAMQPATAKENIRLTIQNEGLS